MFFASSECVGACEHEFSALFGDLHFPFVEEKIDRSSIFQIRILKLSYALHKNQPWDTTIPFHAQGFENARRHFGGFPASANSHHNMLLWIESVRSTFPDKSGYPSFQFLTSGVDLSGFTVDIWFVAETCLNIRFVIQGLEHYWTEGVG